ncbi:MAG: S-layer homology domain-containing protein [Clostridia bacterium]|nr:S-layer homology domain-containing protein [Clostridia bacterium]
MKKRIISMVLCLALLLGALPTAFAATDTRTEVGTFVLTTDMATPAYGGEVKNYFDYTFTEGTMANVPRSMGRWFKKNGENWNLYEAAVFSEGTYYYSNQLRIDSPHGAEYKLASTLSITVDGVQWTHDYVGVYSTYSYVYMSSPEYVVERPANFPLTFTDSYLYDIDEALYVNRAMTPVDYSVGVLGGTGSYTFSKTSGPDWLNVAANGTVTGTPTAFADQTEMVIRVTDEAGAFCEITVEVNSVSMNPADRTTVDTFVCTTNMILPTYGGTVKNYFDYTFTVGAVANIPPAMGQWFKKDGDNWVPYRENVFIEGTYYYSNQLRIDNAAGRTHKLAEELNITVDGEAWQHDTVGVYDTYSYVYMRSPEYYVKQPISSVALTLGGYERGKDMTELVVGATGAGFVMPTEYRDNYMIYIGDEPQLEGGTFKWGTQYVFAYIIRPVGEYTARELTPDLVTLNGEPAASLKKSSHTCVAYFTLPPLAPPANPFVDVKKKDYFYDAVLWAVDEGVTSGVDATHFGPNESCTRAQAVTFMWRAAGCPEPTSKTNPFTDVKKKDYYYKAVLWAVENGITAGASATTFAPNAPCTRGQIVSFLWRAEGSEKVSAANPFTDVKKKDYYYYAVLWAVKNNITAGVSPTSFAPADTCTRGQIVSFLYRSMK